MPYMTLTKARIERTMPRKGQINNGHSKALNKFFDDIYEAIKKYINFEIIRCVVVGSPGFLKDDFMKYLNENAVRRGDSVLVQNKSKFLKVHATSGHKNAIEEALLSEEVKSQLLDVKAVGEVRLLFFISSSKIYRYVSVLN
jgi:protein pelota